MIEIFTGVISGIVSGLGMGGGTILIFLLTNMLGVEQHIAQATNLVFFIPTSIIAIIINIKDQNVDLKLGTILAVYGILGAIIGANIAVKINVNILKKCFGIFLAIIAIHEIYDNINLYKKQKRRHNNKKY